MLYLVIFNEQTEQYRGYPLEDSIDIEKVCDIFNLPIPEMNSQQAKADYLHKNIKELDVLTKIVDVPNGLSPTEQLKYGISKAKDLKCLSEGDKE